MTSLRIHALLALLAVPSFAACAAESKDETGASAEAVSSGSVFFRCVDKDDKTSTASLTVDAGARFSFTVTGAQFASTSQLVSVWAPTPDFNAYYLHDTVGHYLDLDLARGVIALGGFDVECDPATVTVDQAALDRLVAATNASQAKAQTYAVCPLAPPMENGSGPDTITVRPALAGAGAVLEGDDSDGDSWVLLATSTGTAADKVSYTGLGAITAFAAGQHVSPFSAFSSTAGVLAWDSANGTLRPEGACTVTGDAYAKQLIGH